MITPLPPESLPDGEKVARKMLRSILETADEGGRDAVVRAIACNKGWFCLLPSAIGAAVPADPKLVTPLDYTNIALGKLHRPMGGAVLVDGDVRLSQDDEGLFLEGLPVSSAKKTPPLEYLPPAIIRGNLSISGLPRLRSVDMIVTGEMKLSQLLALKSLRGEVFGQTVLRQTGLEKIGADFRAASSLNIFHHPYLKVVNCPVGAEVMVIGSSLEKTGPAFSVGKSANFVDCKSLLKLQGRVARQISFQGCPAWIDCSGLACEESTLPTPLARATSSNPPPDRGNISHSR